MILVNNNNNSNNNKHIYKVVLNDITIKLLRTMQYASMQLTVDQLIPTDYTTQLYKCQTALTNNSSDTLVHPVHSCKVFSVRGRAFLILGGLRHRSAGTCNHLMLEERLNIIWLLFKNNNALFLLFQ